MKIALLFPGQGSQYVGMGRSLWEAFPEVRNLFDRASDLLGFDAREVCFEGPKERLDTTLYTQPMLFLVSVAVFRSFHRELGLPAAFVAGHSLGEYSALVAAGSLTFEEGLSIVRKRAVFMQESVHPGAGGMAAVMGLEAGEVEAICREAADGRVLVPANYNGPDQIVISGEEAPLERATSLVRKRGGKTLRLPVSAPFHSPLMVPASEKLAKTLEDVKLTDPTAPWISNVTASAVHRAADCRRLLSLQVCSPVLWEASMRRMLTLGAARFIELGPRKILKGLCRRIDPAIPCEAAETFDELEALAQRQ